MESIKNALSLPFNRVSATTAVSADFQFESNIGTNEVVPCPGRLGDNGQPDHSAASLRIFGPKSADLKVNTVADNREDFLVDADAIAAAKVERGEVSDDDVREVLDHCKPIQRKH